MRQNFGKNFSEQQKHSCDSDTEDDKLRVTAVMAVMTCGPGRKSGRPTSNKQVPRKKIIKILLDGGSDGDLLFQKKGATKHFPYSARQVPKRWRTLNGVFQMKGKWEVQVKFFEYSNSKVFLGTPEQWENYGQTSV